MIQTKVMNFFHTSFNLWLINTGHLKPKCSEEITLLLWTKLWEEIYKRSAFLHKFLKDSSDSSWQKYRKQRNKCVKVGLLPSKNFYYYLLQRLFASVMKNAFYFILKALFVLKIFKFLSWLFGHVEKTAWLEKSD